MTGTEQKTSSHTPGPWRWIGGHSLISDHARRPAVLSARELRGQEGGHMVPFDAAGPNALLIAAAPELLAALTDTADFMGGNWNHSDEAFKALLAKVRTAIAKATRKEAA